MEEGDYVRTPKGIGKIIKKYSDLKDSFIDLDCGITIDYITKDFTEEEINKMYPSSPNIIDLIEVGDYVNGNKVLNVLDFNDNSKMLSLEKIYDSQITNEDIKSIITKEQIESIEYEVK